MTMIKHFTNLLLQFINVARRSLRETQYLILFSERQMLLTASQRESFTAAYEEVHRMLNSLTYSLGRMQ